MESPQRVRRQQQLSDYDEALLLDRSYVHPLVDGHVCQECAIATLTACSKLSQPIQPAALEDASLAKPKWGHCTPPGLCCYTRHAWERTWASSTISCVLCP